MTPEQNKNFILNNLDKYLIDGKGNFVNLEKDYEDKIIEDIMESILLDKENWEIVYDDSLREITGSLHEKFYKYRPTGETITALSEEFPLADSDLSRQYQDWEEQISNSTDLQQVTKFQEKLLADIQTRREEKKSTSSLLKKFASIPNFNRQENLEALIEPVKNNPDFLQQLQAKQIPSLTALIVDQSPQEIIITVKRFKYDQEKEKEKKIRAYYHLKPSEVLTDNQINNYLYREAIGQITAPTENLHPESNQLTIALIIGGFYMEGGVKNNEKPEIRLLSKLKDRLLNLSTREQKINLRLYQGATYDLVSLLAKTNKKFIEKFESSLLASLLAKNREKEVLVSISSIFRYKSLYLGFLFLRGYFVNSQKLLRAVNAPLFLFPTDLRKGNSLDIVISKHKKVNYTLLYFLRKELELENDVFTQIVTKLEEINNDDFKSFLFALKPIISQLFSGEKIQFNFSVALNNYLEEPNYSLEKIFEYHRSQTKKSKTSLEIFSSISLADRPIHSPKNYLEVLGNFVIFIDKGTNLSLFNDFERIIKKFQANEGGELAGSALGFLLKKQDFEKEKKESDHEKKALCIDGPPGTGKTQLISNLLANGLFYDKKILIVCEKNAALQVIANNLNNIELGSYFIKINELNQTPEVFRRISSILEEKNQGIADQHLFLNSRLGFDFNLETKNKFHNLISNFLTELGGISPNSSLLSSVVSSCLLREINEEYSFLLADVLRRKSKEVTDLAKREELNDFFSFLNLQNFVGFQESCLDASFLNKINEFVDQEFFLLGDLHLLFNNCNEEAQKNIFYFLENSFQQNSPLNYDDYIKITEKAVEKAQKNYFKVYWEKSHASQNLIQSQQKEKRNNLFLDQGLSAELKKKRNLNLRKIFPALLAHFPIWLTTPETISSLTSLEDPLFDYLIFDEASQVPLEKSVPLFARAKKLIVIGDQQQLPPTDFFKKISESEINLEISDLEKGSSLLDYLIEFSNQAFYGGKLEIITKAILKLLKTLPTDKEVGIITFNTKQRDLIEDMIEKKRVAMSNLFVRNLEEVQGDERDIIIFSLGYGPNEEGKFIHNFGPLNREGGEKRLNVAITRAREKVIVVTTCQERDNKEIERLLNDKIVKLGGFNLPADQKKPSRLTLAKVLYDELVKLGYETEFQVGSIGR
ncbi:11690_t:CDS:10 [Funneliformis geosporum]|nr:11690_t:CDS:10 [Funneliformis geosporum]